MGAHHIRHGPAPWAVCCDPRHHTLSNWSKPKFENFLHGARCGRIRKNVPPTDFYAFLGSQDPIPNPNCHISDHDWNSSEISVSLGVGVSLTTKKAERGRVGPHRVMSVCCLRALRASSQQRMEAVAHAKNEKVKWRCNYCTLYVR